jgi:outer membrane lipoprotein-sorting protein
MLQMLDLETALWRADRDTDPANVEVTFLSGAKVGEVECEGFELKHLKHKSKEQFVLTRIYFDCHTKFPVQVEHFDGAEPNGSEKALVEKYTYTDIKTNVGLGESDFDRHNSGKRRN